MRGAALSSDPTTDRITEPSERSTAETSSPSEPSWSDRETKRMRVPPPTWRTLPSASATSARAGSSVFISSPAEIGRLRLAWTSPLDGETTITSPLASRTYEYALRPLCAAAGRTAAKAINEARSANRLTFISLLLLRMSAIASPVPRRRLAGLARMCFKSSTYESARRRLLESSVIRGRQARPPGGHARAALSRAGGTGGAVRPPLRVCRLIRDIVRYGDPRLT